MLPPAYVKSLQTKTEEPRPWVPMLEHLRGEHGYPDLPRIGPWDAEPDAALWQDVPTDYWCRAWRNPMGFWCGYVNVPREHPLWGRGYEDADEVLRYTVHGGMTYAGQQLAEGDWWFGFDCMHAWDMAPGAPIFPPGLDGIYRTLEFVMEETHGFGSCAVRGAGGRGAGGVSGGGGCGPPQAQDGPHPMPNHSRRRPLQVAARARRLARGGQPTSQS